MYIKWKDKDTLIVKCLTDGGLSNKQPIKKELKKWKDWILEIEYYSIYSSGTNGTHKIEKYTINPNFVEFKSKVKTIRFENNEATLELDTNKISVRHFVLDTVDNKLGLSISDYELEMNKSYTIKDFTNLQPFILTKP